MKSPSRQFELSPATASVLRRFGKRRCRLIWARGLAMACLMLAVFLTLLMLADAIWLISQPLRILLSCVAYLITATVTGWITYRTIGNNTLVDLARQLETVDPNLRDTLLSAVELAHPGSGIDSVEFRDRLQRDVATRVAGMNVRARLPLDLIRPWLAAAASTGVIALLLTLVPQLQFGRRLARVLVPTIAIERASLTSVRIIRPDPASGFAASGDAMAVIANVKNLRRRNWGIWDHGDQVSLQVRQSDGEIQQIPMVLRESDPDSPFSASLTLGERPVDYRILAGDAVTLWNTLTPLPRPHAIQFEKRYLHPSYTRLPDVAVSQSHGDLQSIEGSVASMIITFDQPVVDAVIKLRRPDQKIQLNPIDAPESGQAATRFKVELPIKGPRTYQVDAVAARSKLSNPFGRRHRITPVEDTPPVIRWARGLPRRSIVSPTDVMSLAGVVTDDVPLDRLVQKVTINDRLLPPVAIDLPPNQSRHSLAVDWDLTQLNRLPTSGDKVQLQWVAVDRRGQLTESETLEFLVAEEGFDADRNQSLASLRDIVASLSQWNQQAQQDSLAAAVDQANKVITEIKRGLPHLDRSAEPYRSITTLSLRRIAVALLDWNTGAAQLRSVEDSATAEVTRKMLNQQAGWITQSALSMGSLAVTTAAMGDAMAIRHSMEKFIAAESQMQGARRGRILKLTASRLRELESLIDRNSQLLLPSTSLHLDRWTQWTRQWTGARLTALDAEGLQAFSDALREHLHSQILDAELVAELPQSVRGLDRSTRQISSLLRAQISVAQLRRRIQEQAEIEAAMVQSDLRYLADLHLLGRGLKEVENSGKNAGDPVYQEISPAWTTLAAFHLLDQQRRQIAGLAQAEQTLRDSATVRIEHPAVLDHYSVAMEQVIQLASSLKRGTRFWTDVSLTDQLTDLQSGLELTSARQRLGKRRWSSENLESGYPSLRRISQSLERLLDAIWPAVQEARELLESFAPSIAQLAGEASKQTSANQEGDAFKQIEQIEEIDDLIEALRDYSNNIDLLSESQRQWARDADSAGEQIKQARSNASSAQRSGLDQASAIDRLTEILDRTAAHFANASNDEDEAGGNDDDLLRTRRQLRSGERSIHRLTETLDRRDQLSQPLVDTSRKTPGQLLRQMESQLDRQELLREMLDRLARQTQQAAAEELNQWIAQQDTALHQLQTTDPETSERIQRGVSHLQAAARQAEGVQQALIDSALQAADLAGTSQTKKDLLSVTNKLGEATRSLGRLDQERATLEGISRAVDESRKNLQAAIDRLDKAAEQTTNDGGQDDRLPSPQQDPTASSMKPLQRAVRGKQLEANLNLRVLWERISDAARQRAIEARRNRRPDRQDAAAQTQRLAGQQISRIEAEREQMLRQRLIDLESPHPAAALSKQLMKRAVQSLRQTQQQLEEASKLGDASDLGEVPTQTLSDLTQLQTELTERLFRTQADLQRVARHQQRLEKTDQVANPAQQSQNANASTSDLMEDAIAASKQATTDLQSAPQDARLVASASRQMSLAGQSVRRAREILRAGEANGDRSGDDFQSTDAARRFAQTLDELDQAVDSRTDVPNSPVNSSVDGASGSGQNPGDPAATTAASASPTLREALRSMAQQLALDRQIPPGASRDETGGREAGKTPKAAGKSSSVAGQNEASNQAGNPAGRPANDPASDPAVGSSVDIGAVQFGGEDWGQLRSRTEAANQAASRIAVPAEYRQEIETYFRAIAGQGRRPRRSPQR